MYDIYDTNIFIVHVGPQEHSIFLDFLRYSEIPAAITGDASLAEAVSLDKVFMYHPPAWKNKVFPDLIDLAPDVLDDWRDADRIRSFWGCKRVEEANVKNYEYLERFYLKHRAAIRQAADTVVERQKNRDYQGNDVEEFGRLLAEQGHENYRALITFFQQHHFACSMASNHYGDGIDEEKRVLKKSHIFGTGGGFSSRDTASRLWYDPEYQASFHRLNQALIQKWDISKNLAKLIREAVHALQG